MADFPTCWFFTGSGSPRGWRRLSEYPRVSTPFFRTVSCKLFVMLNTEGKRTRPEDLFLLAILLANLVCGVGLIGALRADLSKDLVAGESAIVSSKINA